MASLWEQHKLCKSFSAYFWAPEQIKFYEKVLKKIKEDTDLQKQVKQSYRQSFENHIQKMHGYDKSNSISEYDLISFHYYYGLSKWRLVKRWKRKNILKKSVFKKLREDSKIKAILEDCKKNGYLEQVDKDYVSLTADGSKLESIIGWIEESLNTYGTTRIVFLSIFGTLMTSALCYAFVSVIYHSIFG